MTQYQLAVIYSRCVMLSHLAFNRYERPCAAMSLPSQDGRVLQGDSQLGSCDMNSSVQQNNPARQRSAHPLDANSKRSTFAAFMFTLLSGEPAYPLNPTGVPKAACGCLSSATGQSVCCRAPAGLPSTTSTRCSTAQAFPVTIHAIQSVWRTNTLAHIHSRQAWQYRKTVPVSLRAAVHPVSHDHARQAPREGPPPTPRCLAGKHAPAARSHPARKAAQAPDELG
jgi:hypothetical protein